MSNQTAKAILVVEDDADVRDAVEQVLSEEGYRVHTARDGVVALDELARTPFGFSLIILDVLMPRIDGQEFLDLARERLGNTPVLLFCAGPVAPRILDDPCVVGAIPKPVEVASLLEQVQTHCLPERRGLAAIVGGA